MHQGQPVFAQVQTREALDLALAGIASHATAERRQREKSHQLPLDEPLAQIDTDQNPSERHNATDIKQKLLCRGSFLYVQFFTQIALFQ
jgi:hypothetical protein